MQNETSLTPNASAHFRQSLFLTGYLSHQPDTDRSGKHFERQWLANWLQEVFPEFAVAAGVNFKWQVLPLPQSDNALRSEWCLAERTVVGYSGNMGIAQDFYAIVDNAIELRDCPEVVFLMVGSGFRKSLMIVDVQKHRLEDKVIFNPDLPREALSHSQRCADVYIVSLRPAMEGTDSANCILWCLC